MSFRVRDGELDVALVAGPRVEEWPSIGVRTISQVCSRAGLSVGLFGGKDLRARGVIPFPSTGGLVIVEDVQGRIHRIAARSVIKVLPCHQLADPFEGSHSPGLIPLATAEKLLDSMFVGWRPATALLGHDNRLLRFGAHLLEQGRSQEVLCVVDPRTTGASEKRGYWETEERRFLIAGGEIVVARPIDLKRRSADRWDLRLEDTQGVRRVEVSRVVVGRRDPLAQSFREFPEHSLLFEFEQTALRNEARDVSGWAEEKLWGQALGVQIVRSLALDTSESKESIARLQRDVRFGIQNGEQLRSQPWRFEYEGKWLAPASRERLRAFAGVPQKKFETARVASLECFDPIPCRECENVCPEQAIKIDRDHKGVRSFLIEDRCTGCGKCVDVCPSQSVVLVHANEKESYAEVTLPFSKKQSLQAGDVVTLSNRRGETLVSARTDSFTSENGASRVTLKLPSHLVWEARGILVPSRLAEGTDAEVLAGLADPAETDVVEIFVNGQKRFARHHKTLGETFFEMGLARTEDAFLCNDGSCGRCRTMVDGARQLACQTRIRAGMAVRLDDRLVGEAGAAQICPCLGVTVAQTKERLGPRTMNSCESAARVCRIGEGRCRGQFCNPVFRHVAQSLGLEGAGWIDWRFPWAEWPLKRGPREAD